MTRLPKDLKAFNITVLNLTPQTLLSMRPVTSLENLEGSTQNFHPDGLYSTEIFGRIGSEVRDKQFSYIDIKIPILHPFIVEMLTKLKGLYLGILLGRSFAKWNEETKDFEQSDELNGKTGYDFFMTYFPKIDFEPKGTKIRDFRKKLINDYRKVGIYTKVLVLPAGLRDAEVDEFGQIAENEINDHYRRILSIANTIPASASGPIYDRSRASLHLAFSGLFNLFADMTFGSDKIIQKRLNYRRIHNGTRNVIVAMDTSVKELGDPSNVNINSTFVGLFQSAKGLLPIVCYHLKNTILGECFKYTSHGKARLINPKTLKSEIIDITAKDVAAWNTTEGMEKFVDDFSVQENRARPVVINSYYVALVYLDAGVYKVFYDIDDLPDGFDKKKVSPITNIELLLLSLEHKWKDYIVSVTRFPITGDGSVYPSVPYIKTTVLSDKRKPLDDNWEVIDNPDTIISEYPRIRDENGQLLESDMVQYFDTMAPHVSRHEGLGADHDGDMTSGNFSYDNTALNSTKNIMTKADFYVTSGGTLRNSPVDFIAELTIKNMGN